jgi:hypothetical protein
MMIHIAILCPYAEEVMLQLTPLTLKMTQILSISVICTASKTMKI